MKKTNKLMLLLAIIGLLFSCDDILEEDITNDAVIITAPVEGAVISGNTVNFSWQNLDGADTYRVQVINNDQTTVVDSLVTETTYNYVINPGAYQWRVKGVNFAYETAYTFPVNFTVEASDDLSTQNIVLLTPSDNLYTNDPNFIFTWNGISTADSYTLDIIKNNAGMQTVLQETGITAPNYTADPAIFDEDAEYQWKVKAVNTTSETGFSQRSIFLDRVNPNQPNLVSPTNAEIVTSTTVNFNWTNGADTGTLQTEITNTIEIASDINFTTIINTSKTINNTVQFTFASVGTYYWRVKAIDLATNESDYSAVNSLEIQ